MDLQTTPSTESPPRPCVIDLQTLSIRCRELIDWYDQHLAGHQPSITNLNSIVTNLKLLPPIGGKIGHDIALVTDGGPTRTRDDIVGAIERLRTVASLNPDQVEPEDRRWTARRRPRRRTASEVHPNQPALPGLDLPPNQTPKWPTS